MEPKVTIVSPTYKRSHILANTVKSILEQTYKNFEYIILDDNHTNDVVEIRKTKEVIDSFNDPRIKYIKNTTNLGHPNIFNKCFDLISGEYFMLYGDDDELLPDSLDVFVKYLDSNAEVSLVHGLDMFKGDDGVISKPTPLWLEDKIFDSEVYLKSLLSIDGKHGISLSAVLFRSEIITVNKIKVFGSYQWDVYFFAQLFLYAKKIGYLNRYTDIRNAAIHHTGKDGSDLYLFYINVENLILILKFLEEFPFALAVKNIDINKYRFMIGKKLLVQFMHIRSFPKALLCLEFGLKNIFKVIFYYLVFGIYRPLTYLYGKFTAIKVKFVGKKV